MQRETYNWGHRQGRELALQCSVQSAGCCHSWKSEKIKKIIILKREPSMDVDQQQEAVCESLNKISEATP